MATPTAEPRATAGPTRTKATSRAGTPAEPASGAKSGADELLSQMAEGDIRRMLVETDDESGEAIAALSASLADAGIELDVKALDDTLESELAEHEASSGLKALAEATANAGGDVDTLLSESAALDDLQSEVLDAVLDSAPGEPTAEAGLEPKDSTSITAGPLEALDQPDVGSPANDPDAASAASTSSTTPLGEDASENDLESLDIGLDELNAAIAAQDGSEAGDSAVASHSTSGVNAAATNTADSALAATTTEEAPAFDDAADMAATGAIAADDEFTAASTPEATAAVNTASIEQPAQSMMVDKPATALSPSGKPAEPTKPRWVGPPFHTAVDQWKPEIPEPTLLEELPPVGFNLWNVLLWPLEQLNKPFATLSPQVRSTLGLVAIITLLNTGIAITCLLLLRK